MCVTVPPLLAAPSLLSSHPTPFSVILPLLPLTLLTLPHPFLRSRSSFPLFHAHMAAGKPQWLSSFFIFSKIFHHTYATNKQINKYGTVGTDVLTRSATHVDTRACAHEHTRRLNGHTRMSVENHLRMTRSGCVGGQQDVDMSLGGRRKGGGRTQSQSCMT